MYKLINVNHVTLNCNGGYETKSYANGQPLLVLFQDISGNYHQLCAFKRVFVVMSQKGYNVYYGRCFLKGRNFAKVLNESSFTKMKSKELCSAKWKNNLES